MKQLINEHVLYFLGQCTWRPKQVTIAFGGNGNVDGTGDDGLVGGTVGALVHSSRYVSRFKAIYGNYRL